MRSNNKFAKATRRKGAIERLEKNIADYVTLMKETKDKDILKKYGVDIFLQTFFM